MPADTDTTTDAGPTLSYYDLLAIPQDAKEADVRKAYLRKAAQCHPDKNPDDPLAKETFQAVAEAYECLSNPAERAAYDRKLAQANLPPPPVRPFTGTFAGGGGFTGAQPYANFPFGPPPPHDYPRTRHRPHRPFGPPGSEWGSDFDFDISSRAPGKDDHWRRHGHQQGSSRGRRQGYGQGQGFKDSDPYAGVGFRPTFSYTAPEDGYDREGDDGVGGAWTERYGGGRRERARYAGAGYGGADVGGGRDSRGTIPGSPEVAAAADTAHLGDNKGHQSKDRDVGSDGEYDGSDEDGYGYRPLHHSRSRPHSHPSHRPPFPITGPFVLHNMLRATFLSPPFASRRPHQTYPQHRAQGSDGRHTHPHLKHFNPAAGFAFPIPPFAEIERMLRDLGVRLPAPHTVVPPHAPPAHGPHIPRPHNGAVRPSVPVPAMPGRPPMPNMPMTIINVPPMSRHPQIPLSGPLSPMHPRPAIPTAQMPHRPAPSVPFGIPPFAPPPSGLQCPPPSAVQGQFQRDYTLDPESGRGDKGQPDIRQASWEFTSNDGSVRGVAHVSHATWSS